MKAPRLVKNAKRVAKHSWSFRLSILAAVLSAVELGMGVLSAAPPIPPLAFAALLTAVSLAGAAARLIPQIAVSGDQC